MRAITSYSTLSVKNLESTYVENRVGAMTQLRLTLVPNFYECPCCQVLRLPNFWDHPIIDSINQIDSYFTMSNTFDSFSKNMYSGLCSSPYFSWIWWAENTKFMDSLDDLNPYWNSGIFLRNKLKITCTKMCKDCTNMEYWEIPKSHKSNTVSPVTFLKSSKE